MQTLAISSSSSIVVTAPVGFPGEFMIIARVRGVIAFSMSCAFMRMPCSGFNATVTGVAPHINTSVSYDVKNGDGIITSSPGSIRAFVAKYKPTVAPSTACISVSAS